VIHKLLQYAGIDLEFCWSENKAKLWLYHL